MLRDILKGLSEENDNQRVSVRAKDIEVYVGGKKVKLDDEDREQILDNMQTTYHQDDFCTTSKKDGKGGKGSKSESTTSTASARG